MDIWFVVWHLKAVDASEVVWVTLVMLKDSTGMAEEGLLAWLMDTNMEAWSYWDHTSMLGFLNVD